MAAKKRRSTVGLGGRIYKARLKAGVSQKALADQCQVSASLVSRYEGNELKPSDAMLSLIAQVLGVNIEELNNEVTK